MINWFNSKLESSPESLDKKAVQLWAAETGVEEFDEGLCLSADEQMRLKEFSSVESAQTFIQSRTVLRILLSKYLACAPEELSISYNKFGKPEVKGSGVNFNLAHSGNL